MRVKRVKNGTSHLHDSTSIVHICRSIGKYWRSIGQFAVTVSLWPVGMEEKHLGDQRKEVSECECMRKQKEKKGKREKGKKRKRCSRKRIRVNEVANEEIVALRSFDRTNNWGVRSKWKTRQCMHLWAFRLFLLILLSFTSSFFLFLSLSWHLVTR